MAKKKLSDLTGQIVVLPNITDWTNITPTGSWTANATYSGSHKRITDILFYRARVILTGTPTPAGALTFNLPAGFVIDTAKLPNGASTVSSIGTARWRDASAGFAVYTVIPTVISSTSIGLSVIDDAGGGIQVTGALTDAFPTAAAVNDVFDIDVVLPIVSTDSYLVYGGGNATKDRPGLVTRESPYSGSSTAMPYVAATGINGNSFSTGAVWLERTGSGYHFNINTFMQVNVAGSRTAGTWSVTGFTWPAGTPALGTILVAGTIENASGQLFPIGAKITITSTSITVRFDFVYPAGSAAPSDSTLGANFFIPVAP